MLDNNLPLENTKRNVDVLQAFCMMKATEIRFWNWEYTLDIDDKAAPCDSGKEVFEYILENEIEDVRKLDDINDEEDL